MASRLGEIADEEDPAAIAVVGTPYWMAPEVTFPIKVVCARRGVIAVVGTPYWMAPEVRASSLTPHCVMRTVSAALAVSPAVTMQTPATVMLYEAA